MISIGERYKNTIIYMQTGPNNIPDNYYFEISSSLSVFLSVFFFNPSESSLLEARTLWPLHPPLSVAPVESVGSVGVISSMQSCSTAPELCVGSSEQTDNFDADEDKNNAIKIGLL